MSYLADVCAALEANRWRYLTGVEKGIVRAVAQRDDPTAEDYEWVATIVSRGLLRESEVRAEAAHADQEYAAAVQRIVAHNSRDDICRHIARTEDDAATLAEHAAQGRSRMGAGRRSSSAAVAGEAHAQTWAALRPWRDALALIDGSG